MWNKSTVCTVFVSLFLILKGTSSLSPVCEYSVPEAPGKYFPKIVKNIDCHEVMTHYVGGVTAPRWPPPRFPPKRMFLNMTQDGKMPFKRMWYFSQKYSGKMLYKWTDETIAIVHRKIQKNRPVGYSVSSDQFVKRVVNKYKMSIQGKHGFVVGSEKPWVEAILLLHKSTNVTTIEYGDIESTISNLNTLTPKQAALKYLREKKPLYDYGFTFSSLEHSGLGRYGENLDPCGDLMAMAMSWCLTKPGGLFFINVPVTGDKSSCIEYNAHRRYGVQRMKHMAASWDVIAREKKRRMMEPNTGTIWVLQKPSNSMS